MANLKLQLVYDNYFTKSSYYPGKTESSDYFSLCEKILEIQLNLKKKCCIIYTAN